MRVIVIGAGPAGLTASYLLSKKRVPVMVLEADPEYVGGISKTVRYKGFYFDIGGHRFFSKSKANDVFVSTFVNCPAEPTFCMTHSMKRIWPVTRFQDLDDVLTNMERKNSSDSLLFNLILPVQGSCNAHPVLKELPGTIVRLNTYQFVLRSLSADWLKRNRTRRDLMSSKLCAD